MLKWATQRLSFQYNFFQNNNLIGSNFWLNPHYMYMTFGNQMCIFPNVIMHLAYMMILLITDHTKDSPSKQQSSTTFEQVSSPPVDMSRTEIWFCRWTIPLTSPVISHHFIFSQSCVSLEFLLLNPAVRLWGWNSRTLRVCLLSSTPSHSLLLLSFNDILVIFQHHIKRHRRKSKLLLQLNLFYIDCFSKNSAKMWCGQQIIYLHSLWASCVKKCCARKHRAT